MRSGKWLILGIMLVMLLVVVPVGAVNEDYHAYGDSITDYSGDCYIEAMANSHNPGAVANCTGVNSQTSDWGVTNISQYYYNNPTYFFFMFGLNDEKYTSNTPAQVAQNYISMYRYATANGSVAIPVIQIMNTDDGTSYRNITNQTNFRHQMEDNLTLAGIPFMKGYDAVDQIPFDGILQEANTSYYNADGRHLIQSGHNQLGELAWHYIQTHGNSGQSQLRINASNDGYVSQTTDAIFIPTMRNGGGQAVTNNHASYMYVRTLVKSAGLMDLHSRGGITFPQTGLNSNATIINGSLNVKGMDKFNTVNTTNFSLIDFTPANSGAYANGDYDGTTFTRLANDIANGDFSVTANNQFMLNYIGLSKINRAANTTMMLDHSYSVDSINITGGVAGNMIGFQVVSTANTSGGGPPYLLVNYTIPTYTALPPVANFTSDITSGTAPLKVNFTDDSTNLPGAWNWSFNNVTGNNTEVWWSNIQNPNITLGIGNFSFALNASNPDGFNITPGYYWVNVSGASPAPPIANFTSDHTTICTNDYVQFTDTSTGGTPTSWLWDFGTGDNSTDQNPLYQYNSVGLYNVSLQATNVDGSDWENKTSYITVSSCAAITCLNQTGNITISLLSHSTTSLGWHWDDPFNITKISEDGLYVLAFDNSSDSFIGTDYLPETYHRLKIYNATDYGELNCTTDAIPVAPTPIPMMPSTDSGLAFNPMSYWWIGAILVGILVVFKKW